MRKRPQANPEATRRRILEAAGKLFVKKGFDGVGLREIAAKAKVSLHQPNHHFGGKVDLFAECVRHAVEDKVKLPAIFADPPSFRNAEDAKRQLAERIRTVFLAIHDPWGKETWYGEILALAMHVHMPESVKAIAEGFTLANAWFIAALQAIKPGASKEYVLLWRASLWAQISFYSTARRNMLYELGGRHYSREFLESAADHIAHVMIAELAGDGP